MKTSSTQHMTQHPAYKAARETADRLAAEHAKIQAEIEAINARRNKDKGNIALAAGLSALDGDVLINPKLEELNRRSSAIYFAIGPAARAIGDAIRQASREYYATQAPAVLAAMDGLIAALDGVLTAGEAFKAIRDTGEALGYDYDASGLPIAADERFTEFVNVALPELKRDADRLRDSLDTTLDESVMTIQALSNINLYGISLKIGESADVPARAGRELVRGGSAEATTPGRVRMSKLKNLIGA